MVDFNGTLKKASTILLPGRDQITSAGKNLDGSYFIDIKGKTQARAIMTPKQMFEFCTSVLGLMGYALEKNEPPPG